MKGQFIFLFLVFSSQALMLFHLGGKILLVLGILHPEKGHFSSEAIVDHRLILSDFLHVRMISTSSRMASHI